MVLFSLFPFIFTTFSTQATKFKICCEVVVTFQFIFSCDHHNKEDCSWIALILNPNSKCCKTYLRGNLKFPLKLKQQGKVILKAINSFEYSFA